MTNTHDYLSVPLTTVIGIIIIALLMIIGRVKLLLPILLWAVISSVLLIVCPDKPVRVIALIGIVILIIVCNLKKK